MNELQPVNQNVLLDFSEEVQEQKTHWGIIIPDSAKEKQRIGKVISMSAIENAEIKVGDRVLFKEHSGTEAEFEENKYLIIQYSEILAKIVKTDSI